MRAIIYGASQLDVRDAGLERRALRLINARGGEGTLMAAAAERTQPPVLEVVDGGQALRRGARRSVT